MDGIYVMKSLSKFHNENSNTKFVGFVEHMFVWGKNEFKGNNTIPFTTPWVGAMHNPPNMPFWFCNGGAHPLNIFRDECFSESLKFCKGIYVFSNYFKKYLETLTSVPIESLPQSMWNPHS
jgi:hypothetical protein